MTYIPPLKNQGPYTIYSSNQSFSGWKAPLDTCLWAGKITRKIRSENRSFLLEKVRAAEPEIHLIGTKVAQELLSKKLSVNTPETCSLSMTLIKEWPGGVHRVVLKVQNLEERFLLDLSKVPKEFNRKDILLHIATIAQHIWLKEMEVKLKKGSTALIKPLHPKKPSKADLVMFSLMIKSSVSQHLEEKEDDKKNLLHENKPPSRECIIL